MEVIKVYQVQEIVLQAEDTYQNPYERIECWVQLTGPEFDKRIYGFWDGEQIFKVRWVATQPGVWSWTSGSNQPDDQGLNHKSGSCRAKPWTEQEKQVNPNRRGFIRTTANGHGLEYADGTPFFLLADTWWAASTWRYPLSGKNPDPDWQPGPTGHSFENVIHFRKKQGYNSLGMIACYPNWQADEYPAKFADENGIGIRQAWEKYGTNSAKDMHDEKGNLPFALKDGGPLADFDQLNPAYFQSLDNKMDYLDSLGWVPFLETVRRDHGPSWREYFDWPGSFVRYIQYIVARYGAYNMIFSPVHLDWIIPVYSLDGPEFNEALNTWYQQYGPLPYGQPVTSLIIGGTHEQYGVGEQVPWLTMHSVGNKPRHHGMYPLLETQFAIEPSLPTANLEPYYPGWQQGELSTVAGIKPDRNSDRDNYFGRTQAWGSVLSGGLAGHMYGTGAYDGTTVGEAEGRRPLIWEALEYPAGLQVSYLKKFLLSEGAAYQRLQLASHNLEPRKSADSQPDGLDGWSFMMCNPEGTLAMLYFENAAHVPVVNNLQPNAEYKLKWFDPVSGQWIVEQTRFSTADGSIIIEQFPDGTQKSVRDWALKIIRVASK
ncbi:MAG: apiosidase-like domain-containing protein [Candidatus Cyclobacteriaceae bacterium M3_2C_046]